MVEAKTAGGTPGEVVPFRRSIEAQTLSRYTSEVFWHFVGRRKSDEDSYKILLSILGTGLRVGPKPTSVIFRIPEPGGNTTRVKLDGYPVNCLADIPLKDLPLHIRRYNQFAIGFHKESAINFGFNPVLYVNQFSPEFYDFMRTLDDVGTYLAGANRQMSTRYEHLRCLLGSIAKAGFLQMMPHEHQEIEDEQIQNFYYEREWCSLRTWDFQPKDVAAVLLPDEYVSKFAADKNASRLKLVTEAVTIPYSMVFRL